MQIGRMIFMYQAALGFKHFGWDPQFDSFSCFVKGPQVQLAFFFYFQCSGTRYLPFTVLLILAAWTFSLSEGKEETKDNLSGIVPV